MQKEQQTLAAQKEQIERELANEINNFEIN
jgi:hypothetical protein